MRIRQEVQALLCQRNASLTCASDPFSNIPGLNRASNTCSLTLGRRCNCLNRLRHSPFSPDWTRYRSASFARHPGTTVSCNKTGSFGQLPVEQRRRLQPIAAFRPSFFIRPARGASDVFDAHQIIFRTGAKVFVLPPRRSISRPSGAKLARRLFHAVGPTPSPRRLPGQCRCAGGPQLQDAIESYC
jgi:hypothetical protein